MEGKANGMEGFLEKKPYTREQRAWEDGAPRRHVSRCNNYLSDLVVEIQERGCASFIMSFHHTIS